MNFIRSMMNSAKLSDTSCLTKVFSQIKFKDPHNIQALLNFDKELETNRTKCLNTLINSISEVQNQLRTLKTEVKNDFTMELRDMQYYRVNMFQMEAKISELKERIKDELCSLLKEETELNKELSLAERRVDDWGKPLNTKILKTSINNSCRNSSNQDKNDPLTEFQKFLLSSGGHYGGWEEQDHLLFLRERRKYNGKVKFISSVQLILPEISQTEIEAHEEWYKKYESLKNLQKEAIKKWRENKSLINEQNSEKEDDQKQTSENIKMKYTSYHRNIGERIKEWKRQQQLKKVEQEEREKKEQERLAEERLRKRELQKAKKLAVQQYKEEKISRIENELAVAQKIKELQAIENRARKNILLKVFREQDQQYMDRIRSLRSQSATKNKKTEKLENVKSTIQIVVERNRKRLLQPTQVWSQHCLHQENPLEKTNKIINLQTIPHLAIPSWRKGLSNI